MHPKRRWRMRRTVCVVYVLQNTLESRSAVLNTLPNSMQKPNAYKSKNRRRPERTSPSLSYLCQRQWRQAGAHAPTTYAMWRVKSKTIHFLQTILQCPNLTSTNLIPPKPFKTQPRISWYTGNVLIIKMRGGLRRTMCAVYLQVWEDRNRGSTISNTFGNDIEKRNSYQSKKSTPTSLLPAGNNMSYVSRTVKAMCWQVRMRLRQTQREEYNRELR